MNEENVNEIEVTEDPEEQEESKEPKKPKKDKKPKKPSKKQQIATLEAMVKTRDNTISELETAVKDWSSKYANMQFAANVLVFLLITAVVVLICIRTFKSVVDDGFPSGVELKENFVSCDSDYQDGETIFNFEGYLEKNGFKHWDISYLDDNDDTTVYARAHNKYWGVTIETSLYKESLARTDDDYSYEAKVEFYRVDKSGFKDYSVVYLISQEFDPNTTEIVMDTSSSLMIPRELLNDIDAVLKAKNYDGSANRISSSFYTDSCPFSGLDIEHSVEVNNASATPHDD